MKKIIRFVVILTALFSVAAWSKPNRLQSIIKEADETVSIGILVKDMTTNKVIFSKNPNHYYMPASNEKILTAYAALQYLGNDFTYQTRLNSLNDTIYFQFTGDPTLTLEQLDGMIGALASAGIHQINTNIIIDDTAFDQVSLSKGSAWEDKDYCWSAPISALIINHNCVKATVTPAAQVGAPAVITLPDYPQSIQFINQAITGAAEDTSCVLKVKRTDTTTDTISGCIKVNEKPKMVERAIANPRDNIQFILSYLLKKHGIAGTYQFEFKKLDNAAHIIATETSMPMSAMVKSMLKESDNIISNAVFKTIGSLYSKEAGSFDNGSAAVRAIIFNRLKLDIPKTTLIDGNGGSRYDFLTPNQLVTLLQKVYTSPLANTFVPALPISGVDGTLQARMTNNTTRGKVLAKTGTETAVSTLSGYLETRKKHTLVFSIMMNNFVDLPKRYQDIQDALCAAMIEGA